MVSEMVIENLVNSKVLAQAFGLDERRIQQLTKEGVLEAAEKEGRKNLYNLVPTVRKYVQYLKEGAVDDELQYQKLKAEVRIKENKAAESDLLWKELEGKMHRAEDVEAVLEDLALVIRGMLLALPGRLAVELSNMNSPPEISERIRKEVYEILTALARYQYNPAEYRKRVNERRGRDRMEDDVEE